MTEDDDFARKKGATRKIRWYLWAPIALLVAGSVAYTSIIIANRNKANEVRTKQAQVAAQEAAQATAIRERNKRDYEAIHTLASKLENITSQDENLPSTTTMTNGEWDSHYDQEISQVNNTVDETSGESASEPKIQDYANSVRSSGLAFITYVQAEKANIDLQFTVDVDKLTVKNDQDYESRMQSLNEQFPTGDTTYLDQAKTDLSTAQSTLKADQTAYAASIKERDGDYMSYSTTRGDMIIAGNAAMVTQ